MNRTFHYLPLCLIAVLPFLSLYNSYIKPRCCFDDNNFSGECLKAFAQPCATHRINNGDVTASPQYMLLRTGDPPEKKLLSLYVAQTTTAAEECDATGAATKYQSLAHKSLYYLSHK